MSVYFVGGASSSGKTTTARSLSIESGLGMLELDLAHRLIRTAIIEEDLAKPITKKLCQKTLEECVASDINLIIEGGWVNPCEVDMIRKSHDSSIFPVFCGFPGSKPQLRLEELKRFGDHWLCRRSESWALGWLQEQIDESAWYRDQCDRFGFEFIDFTDFVQGTDGLTRSFNQWLTEERQRKKQRHP